MKITFANPLKCDFSPVFFFEYSTAHISKKCWEQRLKYGGAGVSGEAKVESVQLVENMSIKKTKKKQNEY